jgi:predicted glutamine amidotransferase
MCRFAAYLGPSITLDTLVTRPVNSIIHQSYKSQEREEPLNGDGFGVGWYVPELDDSPAVFRSISPAWNNTNLLHLARVTRSGCIFAHVRAASPGLGVTGTNCHPFIHGPFCFMHNGFIADFGRIRRTLLSRLSDTAFDVIRGTTDTEVLFALFLDHFQSTTEGDQVGDMGRAIDKTLATVVQIGEEEGVESPHQLNLAVTDGHSLVASRYTTGPLEAANSLYIHTGKRYVCEDGTCRMLDPDEWGAAVLVTSERLSEDQGWERIPPNRVVLVDANHGVEMRPVAGRSS